MKRIVLFLLAAAALLPTACVAIKVGLPFPRVISFKAPAPEVKTVSEVKAVSETETETLKAPDFKPDRILSPAEAGRLQRSAMLTYNAYRKQGKPNSGFIPYDCWDEEIRKLNPIYVYVHQFNVAVVQAREYHEYGLYFTNGISSYTPHVGSGPDRDGFMFHDCSPDQKRGGVVYGFKRDLQNQIM